MKMTRKWLPLAALTLLLSACGEDPTPNPGPTEQAGKIVGALTPWTPGKAKTVRPPAQVIEKPLADLIAAVNDQGQFDLSLPKHGVMTRQYGDDLKPFNDSFGQCDSLNTTAPAALKIAPLSSLFDENKKEYKQQPNATTFRQWWFLTDDAKVNFKGKCLAIGEFDSTLDFKRGWNVVEVKADGTKSSYALIKQPTDRLAWTATTPQLLSAQGLHPDFLHPWMTLEKYKHRGSVR